MNITKEWIETLAKKYGVKPKVIKDSIWPNNKNRGLGYFDQYTNIGIKTVETIADVLHCSVDELLRRPTPSAQIVAGDNNTVGNVNINSDVKVLQDTIRSLQEIISRQDLELARKDSELKAKNSQIDRLIKLAQGNSVS